MGVFSAVKVFSENVAAKAELTGWVGRVEEGSHRVAGDSLACSKTSRHLLIPLFIYLFSKHVLSNCHVPDTG